MKTEFYTLEEFGKVYKELGIKEEDYQDCLNVRSAFRTGVEVYKNYTITQLRIIAGTVFDEEADYMTLIVKKDAFIVVENKADSDVVRKTYDYAIEKCNNSSDGIEKYIAAFFEGLTYGDDLLIEEAYLGVVELEDVVVNGDPGHDFNKQLLEYKRYMLVVKNYYDQLIDVLEALEDNYNEIIEAENVRIVSNSLRKVNRLKEDNDALIDAIVHIQGAYSSHLDMSLNATMKVLTIITTVFMPLTLIVGWYGMNFKEMPELAWKYGYIYVIILSFVMVIGLFLIARRKKWF